MPFVNGHASTVLCKRVIFDNQVPYAPVAQRTEHPPPKRKVEGLNPSRGTKFHILEYGMRVDSVAASTEVSKTFIPSSSLGPPAAAT